MWEGPHEHTTLLAKHTRRYSALSEQHMTAEKPHSDTRKDSEEMEAPAPAGLIQHPPRRLSSYLLEPLVLLLVFAYNLSSTIMKSQIIYQTCIVVFDYNETDCRSLGTQNASDHVKHIETEVQPYAARIFMSSTLIESIVPALCGSFIGAWSDRFGRKPLLIAAYSGYALFYSIAALIAHLASDMAVSPWYYLCAVLPEVLLGGSVTYSVAAWCYISDVSSASERPYRMAVYEAAIYMGLMLGSLSAGYIYEGTSVTIVFAISAGTIVFAIFIIIACLPESLQRSRLPTANGEASAESEHLEAAPEQQPAQHSETNNKFSGLFDRQRLQEMLQTCFRPRECSDRAIIWFTIAALLISVFVIDGSMTVFYLFVRQQLHWTVRQYTTYETVGTLVPVIGNLLGLWLLRKWLQMSVLGLAILAFLSQTASYFMKGFAMSTWQLYLAIALGAFKSLGNPMCRTIISNVVPANELGKIFCFHKMLETLLPFMASPVYTIIYSITLTTFAGFFNLLSANLLLLALACLLVILRKKQNDLQRYGAILN